jgi:hypothetical protein
LNSDCKTFLIVEKSHHPAEQIGIIRCSIYTTFVEATNSFLLILLASFTTPNLIKNSFQILGGYFSPVSDAYNKPGLAPADHRVRMCELALDHSDWLMVDPWESQQLTFQRTTLVLDHFSERLNGTFIIEYVIALFIFGYINNVR